MLRSITTAQLMEWRHYADLEPFDEVRADFRSAQVVAAILNQNRRKGARALTLKDCVLRFTSRAKVRTPEEVRAEVIQAMRLLTAANNARVAELEDRKRKRREPSKVATTRPRRARR